MRDILTDEELHKAWEAVAPYDPPMVYAHGLAANADRARLGRLCNTIREAADLEINRREAEIARLTSRLEHAREGTQPMIDYMGVHGMMDCECPEKVGDDMWQRCGICWACVVNQCKDALIALSEHPASRKEEGEDTVSDGRAAGRASAGHGEKAPESSPDSPVCRWCGIVHEGGPENCEKAEIGVIATDREEG